jgi:hypothetical protein
VEGSCEHGDEPSGSIKLLGISSMTAQLAASQEELSSVSKYSLATDLAVKQHTDTYKRGLLDLRSCCEQICHTVKWSVDIQKASTMKPICYIFFYRITTCVHKEDKSPNKLRPAAHTYKPFGILHTLNHYR